MLLNKRLSWQLLQMPRPIIWPKPKNRMPHRWRCSVRRALRLPICHRKISQLGAQLRKKRLTKSSSLMFQTGKRFWIWLWQSTNHQKKHIWQAALSGAVCSFNCSVRKTACLVKAQRSQRGSGTIDFYAQWRQFQRLRGGVRRQ